jgi:hypothetical protein
LGAGLNCIAREIIKVGPLVTLPLEIRGVVDITNYEITSKLRICRYHRFGNYVFCYTTKFIGT